jgi:aryl sulfotransferase
MLAEKPFVEHIYQNHSLDSTRWNRFSPRRDDIVIATPFKSGTTWMQFIVMQLIFKDLELRSPWDFSVWPDAQWKEPVDDMLLELENQKHRRFIKTHLPLDGLPYFEEVKYIIVGRDARDVFISLWDFYGTFNDRLFEILNANPFNQVLPRRPEDIREFWRNWISRGWFEWENEGYPFWSNLRHIQTWWNYKHLPNLLFVHFNDLLSDLEGEIQRIADYLQIELDSTLRSGIAQTVTFPTLKANAERLGVGSLVHKGINGRWREHLTEEDLELYHAAVVRELTPDCARWLENGLKVAK